MSSQFSLANLFAWMTLAAVGAAMVYWFGARGAASFALATVVAMFMRLTLSKSVSPLILSALLMVATGIASMACGDYQHSFAVSPQLLFLAGCLVGIVSQLVLLPRLEAPEGATEKPEPITEEDPPSWGLIVGVAVLLIVAGGAIGATYGWLATRGGAPKDFPRQFTSVTALGLIGGTLVAAAYVVAVVRKG